jgi:hypothetical protein
MTPPAPAVEQISYIDLYARWEKSNWRATELDFTVDRKHWRERFTDAQRRAAVWNYALFLHGEDSVTDNLSPFIDAAPREEQKYFLATQQVDEARHAVLFSRFMREVVNDRSENVSDSLSRSRPELTWGFQKLFALLDQTTDDLRTDRSRPRLAAAIALYHLVIEATVAQTGQHFIDGYLERGGLLPGFHAGLANVANDEQRHIAFGVKLLYDLGREDPECKDAVAEVLRKALRYAAVLFVPPNWDMSYIECFGSTFEELSERGLLSLQTKLRSAGMPVQELPGALPFPVDLSPREQAQRSLKLARAGVLGEKNGRPSSDPEIMSLVFDAVRRSIDPRRAPRYPVTIQWEFTDAPEWHLRIADGYTSVAAGRAENPELTLRSRWEDWVDVALGREDARIALLRRKLRARGSPRLLVRVPTMFGV